MMIICDKHGYQTGPHVSPDFADHIRAGRPLPPYRKVTYCYEGPYLNNYLTESFAAENGANEVGDVDLPDDYPDWFRKLVPICGRCVEQAIGRSMDAE